VTHSHPEGLAGTLAIAVAAALAWQKREAQVLAGDFLEEVARHAPPSEVRDGIATAQKCEAPENVSIDDITRVLGNGAQVTAQDTVPFVLWCAAHRLVSYEESLWLTVSGLGDRDTTCAMAGGIVALSSRTPIPADWAASREPLPSA
jgi:ADP-ribosylglycohydrolase